MECSAKFALGDELGMCFAIVISAKEVISFCMVILEIVNISLESVNILRTCL